MKKCWRRLDDSTNPLKENDLMVPCLGESETRRNSFALVEASRGLWRMDLSIGENSEIGVS
jgi:hypothetical protein